VRAGHGHCPTPAPRKPATTLRRSRRPGLAGQPAASRWQKLVKRVTRAEPLFKVATLDRQRGMELMGTEGPPDEAVMGGAFASGVGQEGLPGDEVDQPTSRSGLLGPDEARRFAASAPTPISGSTIEVSPPID
jgi:cellulose synthase operon protein C